ncbi:MAG: HepT-like ribonuclease domain-containing protein [Kiritimatiellia bacterium]|jgi:uncharacterized protein with HEPN domain
MSRHDDSVTLRQMLDYIEEAIALVKDRTRADIESDRVFFLALLKLVEIVGEAATRISEPMQVSHPEITWHEIIGTRNRLIHGYDAVDYNILWDIVTADFPSLAAQLKSALKSTGQVRI